MTSLTLGCALLFTCSLLLLSNAVDVTTCDYADHLSHVRQYDFSRFGFVSFFFVRPEDTQYHVQSINPTGRIPQRAARALAALIDVAAAQLLFGSQSSRVYCSTISDNTTRFVMM